MKEQDFLSDAKVFKALSDETRLYILYLLQSGERCGAELLKEVSVGQPTLSHHMKILCAAQLVTPRHAGKWTYYTVSEEGCMAARDAFARAVQLAPEPDTAQTPIPAYLL